MTRLELLTIVVGRARSNGFEFRRWYTARLNVPWISAKAALQLLESQRRYYALLFSHEFAQSFWKPGIEITFEIPGSSFQRRRADGTIVTVERKPFIKRSTRPEAWKYHLKEMALAEEPLRYIRKYLAVEDELEEDMAAGSSETVELRSPKPRVPKRPRREKPIVRPLPTDMPEFLRRPYR
ncbi:MAG: hypothetical protein PW735_00455 [Acidobacteriaceae bacterium]|nr:hypothetical protein [Acidobacteriaceae bacterium]